MKKLRILLSAALLLTLACLPATPVFALGNNLAPNASFETANGAAPTDWMTDSWGTNTPSFAYENTGHTGNRSASVTVSGYKSGDAKWFFTPVAATGKTQYTYSDWYKSTVKSSVDAVITTTAGKTTYKWLGDIAASSDWKQASLSFKTPANAKTITFYHYIQANGTLTIDDVNFATTAGTPTTPTPPTAPTVQLSAPANNATVSGTQVVSATATDAKGVASVQFKLDGNNLGAADTTAPYGVSWDTTGVANGSHTLTATATNTSGLTATTGNTTVNVNNTVVTPPTPPTDGPTNLIANPSVETVNGTTPASWVTDKWGTNTTNFSVENTGRTGNHSLKTTVSAYTSGDAKWMFNSVPVTANQVYTYSNWYKSDVATEVDAMVTMSDGSIAFYWVGDAPASADWKQFSSQFTMPAGAVSATLFQIVGKKGYVQTDDYSLTAGTPAPAPSDQFSRGLVSLTFDDAWRNIYSNGLPLLQKYNLPSTQYMLTEPTIGEWPDYMTIAMMQAFKNQGSEIASHTVSHADLVTLNQSQLTNELVNSQNQLRQWFGTAGVAENFATPYGSYNATVVNEIKKYYRSHRSTDVGFNSKNNFDIYNIKVQNITDTTTPAQVQAWVNQAIANKTWLVLVYHEVTASAADPTYAVTPANLDAELNIIKQSGVTVKTVSQALDEVQAQL